MFSSKALLSLLLVASSAVDASPLNRRDSGLPSLRFATRFNEVAMRNIAGNDRARARSLHKRSTYLVDVTGQGVNYVAQVNVGSPPTSYQLLVNTQTGNTFVGASKPYNVTETSVDTGNSVSASFGFGSSYVSWSGEEWEDTVALSDQLVIKSQSIGVADMVSGDLGGNDGVLGLGSTASTQGTVQNTGEVPTVADNIYAQIVNSPSSGSVYPRAASFSSGFGAAPQGSGVRYGTESSQDFGGGKLTFGGYDTTFVVGTVSYVPLTTTPPASANWGIDMSVEYNGVTIMENTAGILDIGTTLILLPTDAYQMYQKLTGSTVDPVNGLLFITPAQYANLGTLTFLIGYEGLALIPDAQIWPRSMNAALGGTSDKVYLVIGDSGAQFGSGLDFILGHPFFLRYYTVYDSTPGNPQVGFGYTQYSYSVLNSPTFA